MRWLLAAIVVGSLALMVDPPVTTMGADEPEESAKPIHISELRKRPVIGWLGFPLGEIVTVEGVVADGSFTRLKKDSGATLLRVQSVNGRPLAAEHVFHFHPFRTSNVEKPKVGARFKYIGYETGGFTGIPERVMPPFATTGFGLTTTFEIVPEELLLK